MSIRRKLLKKLAKRLVSKGVIRKGAKKFAKKAMTFAQKGALKKAVRASALARRKATKKLAKQTLFSSVKVGGKSTIAFRKMSRKQVRAIISTKTAVKHFKPKMIGGKLVSASTQSRLATKQLRVAVKGYNSSVRLAVKSNKSLVRATAKAAKATSVKQYGIDLPRSLAYSALLTAAFNPEYTVNKYQEAKRALARKLSGR